MLWNGNKRGNNEINENLKATISSTDHDRYKKHVQNVGHFNYLGTMITNDARCTGEITSRTVKANAAFNNFLTSKLDLNLGKKLVKC